MWTGGGYWPPVNSKPGLPTYVVIAELMRCSSVADALRRMESMTHAGCFLFFLADASGDAAIVEGIPGQLAIESVIGVKTRANHYEDSTIVKAVRQRLPPRKESNTKFRKAKIEACVRDLSGRVSLSSLKKILTGDEELYKFSPTSMTIDSFVAVCEERLLCVSRGGSTAGPWRDYFCL